MKFYTGVCVLILLLLFHINSFSQIPNAGFETWSDGAPEGWFVNNIPGFAVPVTQSNDSHSGSSALKLDVVPFVDQVYPGYVWSGGNFLEGFPVSQAHGSLTGYYKFNRAGDDEVYILVYMLKNGSYVGIGGMVLSAPTDNYVQFAVPIQYLSGEVPDTSFIWIGISDSSDGQVTVGSSALIDDLEFGAAVDVKDKPVLSPEKFSLEQNYPNPFNPSTRINFSVKEQSYVELKVYNLLGSEIQTLVSGNRPAGEYSVNFNAENLPGGVYIAKMKAGRFSKAIKMILLK